MGRTGCIEEGKIISTPQSRGQFVRVDAGLENLGLKFDINTVEPVFIGTGLGDTLWSQMSHHRLPCIFCDPCLTFILRICKSNIPFDESGDPLIIIRLGYMNVFAKR